MYRHRCPQGCCAGTEPPETNAAHAQMLRLEQVVVEDALAAPPAGDSSNEAQVRQLARAGLQVDAHPWTAVSAKSPGR